MQQVENRNALKCKLAAGVCLAAICLATGAQATITISSQPTQNMTCANGVCAPTAKSAVLNIGDLEADLASGNVTVTTTGTGINADNIDVKTGLSWATAFTLSLMAHRSITIDEPVSVAGLGGVTIQTEGRNGALSFGKKGNVNFANLSSQLTINGNAYTLVGDLPTLASDIAANPAGYFALAASYDATGDDTASIPTVFTGRFEGLGNPISNLVVLHGVTINGEYFAGLFAEVGANGTLADVDLLNASVSGGGPNYSQGLLAGGNLGTIQFCNVSGSVFVFKARGNVVVPVSGGLVGTNWGTIANSYATANTTTQKAIMRDSSGGLVGNNLGVIAHSYATGTISGFGDFGGLVSGNTVTGTISNSYATGAIKGGGSVGIGGLAAVNMGIISGSYAIGPVKATANFPNVGGLVGENQFTIKNSYATGAVTGGSADTVGGLVGWNRSGTIGRSYSTGAVSGTGTYIGGLIGTDNAQSGSLIDTDWDTDTSGITNLSQGAGNIANDPGITGLSTAQFQSGLPPGFDPKVWAENPNINGGLPYLLANVPVK